MRYDVKVYDGAAEERETIRGLTYGQMGAIVAVLDWAHIKYYVKDIEVNGAAQAYLRSCKGLAKYASVDKVVETFRIDPKNAKAILRWNGSMACKFLRLAGAWDGLDQAEKNVILGYEVQQQEGQ